MSAFDDLDKKYKTKIQAPQAIVPESAPKTASAFDDLDAVFKPNRGTAAVQGAISGLGTGIPEAIESFKPGVSGVERGQKVSTAVGQTAAGWGIPIAVGAGAGSVIPGVGTLAGAGIGLIEAALQNAGFGALTGFLQPEIKKIGDALDAVKNFSSVNSKIPGMGPLGMTVDVLNSEAASTVAQIAPLLLGLGKGKPIYKDIPLSPEASAAKEMGIPFTASAEAIKTGGPQNLIEKEKMIQNKYPNQYMQFDQKKLAALKQNLANIAGPSAGASSSDVGATIQRNLEGSGSLLGNEFSGIEKKVIDLKTPGKRNLKNQTYGDEVAKDLEDFLTKNKVKEVQTGNELITDPSTVKRIRETIDLVKNAKSTQDLLQQKRTFSDSIDTQFKKDSTRDTVSNKQVYKILDDAIYNSIPDKKLAGEWRDVNTKWHEHADNMFKLNGIRDANASEVFHKYVLGKKEAGVKALKEEAGAEAVKSAGMQYMFYDATKNEILNVSSMEKKLNELKNAGLAQEIFGDDLQKLEKFVKVGKFVEAPLTIRNMPARGGSPTQPLLDIAKMTPDPNNFIRVVKAIGGALGEKGAGDFLKKNIKTKEINLSKPIVQGVGGGLSAEMQRNKKIEETKKRLRIYKEK